MAASAGTMTLVGASGRTYSVDLYLPDATGTSLTFSSTGLSASTSPNSWRVPETCSLYDLSIGTAPTAVGCVLSVDQGVVSGASFRWANQLQTLANRQKINIPIKAGAFISFTQF